jgi:hypothetical protein
MEADTIAQKIIRRVKDLEVGIRRNIGSSIENYLTRVERIHFSALFPYFNSL